ncbi:MAG TPA: pantoate--beta-alanine ligase [Bryobacteraceae bacterium]|nr:pantoate--beta-alanine ligase [Bryobacteraceae bacterium]
MPAILAATVAEVRAALADFRRRGQLVGLVPTMGALHAGHAALIERARRECGCMAVSIFVNPIQFDRREDYEAYAIRLPDDVALCESLGTDVIFAPAAEEMYPAPQSVFVEVAGLTDHLCGRFRPGHFRGVATVVAKLFHIVAPHRAYFGEKDAQQLAVIQRMVADLNMPVEIVPVATVRDPDGLAVSSRNRRLSPEERRAAPALFQALQAAAQAVASGARSAAEAKAAALAVLEACPEIRVEYLEVVDPATMAPVEQISGPVRIAAAVWLGATRLIDNLYCPAVAR